MWHCYDFCPFQASSCVSTISSSRIFDWFWCSPGEVSCCGSSFSTSITRIGGGGGEVCCGTSSKIGEFSSWCWTITGVSILSDPSCSCLTMDCSTESSKIWSYLAMNRFPVNTVWDPCLCLAAASWDWLNNKIQKSSIWNTLVTCDMQKLHAAHKHNRYLKKSILTFEL